MATYHEPVLLQEVLSGLNIRKGGSYLDLTLGGGGHAEAVLKRLDPHAGVLAGADQDQEALEFSKERLSSYPSFHAFYGNFGETSLWEEVESLAPFDGILMDLGVSSHQLDQGARGFSFSKPALLDMRMDRNSDGTAWQAVNRLPEKDLADIIFQYGEERRSRRIARAICSQRPVDTTVDLAEIVRSCFPASQRRSMSVDPATRTFQGIRIYVNRELERLETGLTEAVSRLRSGGRLVVISYHSLEDRIVKNFIRTESRDCLCPKNVPVCVCGHKASLKAVNKKVIVPGDGEMAQNPRSRSARMRVAERL
jgi:16S rRNA (cytosine1402-N4)-methyltransferase